MKSTEKDLFLQDLNNRKHKRNAVKEMDYSSSDDDSDNDSDDSDSDNNIKSNSKSDKKVRFDSDTKTSVANDDDDDDDDDMFASDTEDKPEPTSTLTTTGSKKKRSQQGKLKGIHTLDMAVFEQQLNDTNEDSIKLPELQSNPDIMDEDDDDDDDDEEGDDDDDEKEMIQYYNNQESSHFETENAITKKKKRIRQPKMESFNLKKEMREGVFDESGNYIRNTNSAVSGSGSESDDDEDEDEDDSESSDADSKTFKSRRDTWLQGINKKDIEKARLAEQKRLSVQKAKFIELKKQARSIDTADILGKFIVLMVPAETVLELLQRLNGDVKRLSKQLKKKTKKTETNTETEGCDVGEKVKKVKLLIKDVTKFVGLLEDRGFKDVYDISKEQLGRAFRRVTGKEFIIEPSTDTSISTSTSTAIDSAAIQENQEDTEIGKKRKREDEEDQEDVLGTDAETPAEIQDNGIMWEYKWSQDDEDEELYGPFDSATMEAWKESYFQENVAYARRVGDSNGEFVDVRELQFL
ncbi:unnamed protein product [Ambrosiozyma monospora]|uniref:Unnamed protein product n=1 Tax=Ambrosiozyma monospora TaxID=43982 RepID=A0A9W6YW47_AMBMO|nr:unnamed protein product [Ambrosiozyma monospora]